jgi:amino acid transporter
MSAPPASAPERLEHGALGVSSIVFFVVAAAAPLTVMAGIAPLAIMIGGISAPAGYLIAGLILTVFAVAFTAMSKYIHNAGAFYSYIARGLGKPAGLGAAALAVYSYNAIQIGLYGAFGYFAAMTAKDLTGLDLPWWAWAAAGIAVVWFFGYRSIHGGAKILGGLLIAETGILALLAAAILVKGGAHGLSLASFAPVHVVTGGMGSVLALAFGAFIGFEATAIYREEARTPDRTVPRATYVAVGFLGLFYAFISWVIIQAFGNTGAVAVASKNPASMFFTAMTTYVGGWATDLMRVLIVTSLFAALLAFHNAITRYTYALASEGALPRQLGRIHPVHKSPYIAGYAQTALAALVVAGFAAFHADPYLQLLLWVNTPGVIGIVVLQALTAFAVWRFFRRTDHTESAARTLVAPLVAGILLTGAAVLIIWKINLLTAAGPAVNWTLIGSVPAVFALGAGYAVRMRRRRPEVYARLATTDVDAEDLAVASQDPQPSAPQPSVSQGPQPSVSQDAQPSASQDRQPSASRA